MSEQAAQVDTVDDGAAPRYDESYYANYWGGGGPYERNERWQRFFGEVADGIVRDFHPTSVLDAGCAIGLLVEALRARGVEASGFDVSEYAISRVHESVAEHCRVGSLTEPIEGRYDLITCIEVIEHLPPEDADRALANICAATDRLLISTTPEDFGEPTHLNVLAPEAWSAKLAELGFLRDLDRDLAYLSPWAALYTRREEDAADVVRDYDRAWWRMRREILGLRKSLLETQNRAAQGDSAVGEVGALRRRLEESEKELLRLRDLLIGKDIELGAAKGRVAEFEDRWERLENAKSKIPGYQLLKKVLRRG